MMTGSRPCPTWSCAASATMPDPAPGCSAHTGSRHDASGHSGLLAPGTDSPVNDAAAGTGVHGPAEIPDGCASPDAVSPHLSWGP